MRDFGDSKPPEKSTGIRKSELDSERLSPFKGSCSLSTALVSPYGVLIDIVKPRFQCIVLFQWYCKLVMRSRLVVFIALFDHSTLTCRGASECIVIQGTHNHCLHQGLDVPNGKTRRIRLFGLPYMQFYMSFGVAKLSHTMSSPLIFSRRAHMLISSRKSTTLSTKCHLFSN